MLKKFVFLALVIISLSKPTATLASEVVTEQIICPQPYGGGVVCGVRTHTVVNTGIADNLPLFGALTLGASGILLYFSRKINKSEL